MMRKLSDIRGEEALEVIANLIDPISNLATSPEVQLLVHRETLPEGADPKKYAVERLKAQLPALIRARKADLIAVLAAIDGVPRENYTATLSLGKLFADAMAVLSDREFLEFFTSAQQTEQTRSGSAPETTTE